MFNSNPYTCGCFLRVSGILCAGSGHTHQAGAALGGAAVRCRGKAAPSHEGARAQCLLGPERRPAWHGGCTALRVGPGARGASLKFPGLSGSPEPSEQPRTPEWQEGVSSGRRMPGLWSVGSSLR